MIYEVGWEQKDYGHGSHCYRTKVYANSAQEAEEEIKRSKCGCEDVYSVKLIRE